MEKLAIKLAELGQRVWDLEAQIARQSLQAEFLGEHGRSHREADEAVVAMQKRLSSLKRSCQILARQVMPRTQTML